MIVRFLVLMLLLFLIFAALVTVLWLFFGLWTILVVLGFLVVGVTTGWMLRGRMAEAVFSIPFRAKGAALRGATAEFHSVEVLDGAGNHSLRLRVDVTVSPAPDPAGPFRHWEPGEVMLVPKPKRGRSPDTDLNDCETESVLAWNGSEFTEPEFDKVPGSLRLQITGTVPPATKLVALRYYFEVFGEGNVA